MSVFFLWYYQDSLRISILFWKKMYSLQDVEGYIQKPNAFLRNQVNKHLEEGLYMQFQVLFPVCSCSLHSSNLDSCL